MQRLGYGPVKRLAVTVTTRNVAAYRDPAVILIDQLKDIYIDGTLNPIDTTQWYQCAATGESSAGVSPRPSCAGGLERGAGGLRSPRLQKGKRFCS